MNFQISTASLLALWSLTSYGTRGWANHRPGYRLLLYLRTCLCRCQTDEVEDAAAAGSDVFVQGTPVIEKSRRNSVSVSTIMSRKHRQKAIQSSEYTDSDIFQLVLKKLDLILKLSLTLLYTFSWRMMD